MAAPDERTTPSHRRLWLPLTLAVVGLVAALIGALGPAKEVRTTYSWPPKELPAATPERAWYTPLLLIRHTPESLSARVPCTLPAALRDAERPVTVLATARAASRNGGLALTAAGERLVVTSRNQVLGELDLRATGSETECAYRIHLADERWMIDGGAANSHLEGALDTMPVVFGLFSAVDLRSESAPTVDITTQVHATPLTLRQSMAWAVSALSILTAFLLVALTRRPRPWAAIRSSGRAARANAHATDAVVAAVLVGWWVLSPAFWDDGWVIATSRTFSESGGISNYFSAYGVNLPNDVWLQWMQHWLVDATSVLILLRIPSLVCLAVTWVICRWALARVLGPSGGRDSVALWALASAFLLGALAWGMTLRPEPVTSLLVVAVLACMVRFVERERAAPLVVAAVLVPLAVTAHQAGVVALAPVIVAAPALWQWVRRHWTAAATVVTASAGLAVTLAFVGTDAEHKRADLATFQTFVWSGDSWHDEVLRYARLGDVWFGTPIRRATVALMLLTVAAFLLRRSGARPQRLLNLPASALAVGLLLLLVTPYKWPWHFGAMTGLAAVAAAAETARLRDAAAGSRHWDAWPFAAILAATIAAAWAWAERSPWNALDLRTLTWIPGLRERYLATALILVVLAAALLIGLVRGRRGLLYEVPWHTAALTAPLLAAPLIVLTVGLLAADSVRTESWTLTRQNIASLGGKGGCGLAEDVLVVARQSVRPLPSSEPMDVPPVPSWVSPTPGMGVPRFVLEAPGKKASSPWFDLPDHGRFGLFVAGSTSRSRKIVLEWGRRRAGAYERLGSVELVVQFEPQPESATVPWAFVAAAQVPPRDPRATAVRVALQHVTLPDAIPSEEVIAVTAPVTYANETLARSLERSGESSLVIPNWFTYYPCARQPLLEDGIVDVPRLIVSEGESIAWLRDFGGSPFEGLLDLYPLERLSIADSVEPPADASAFAIDRIPGAVVAPPDKTTASS